jgi:RimJ/RimL family protein N-acetyltransferase
VRLEPLTLAHAAALLPVARESDWSWMPVEPRTEREMTRWIEDALRAQERDTEYPFVVFSNETGDLLGSTRYMDVRIPQKGVEVGWTWYSSKVWGTVVNPECKFLLLQHAFEDWGAIRVQLKTDDKNVHSQGAILKLGAKYEGRLRNHRIRRDGSSGDSVMYSITVEEWQSQVKRSLRDRIDAFNTGPMTPAAY